MPWSFRAWSIGRVVGIGQRINKHSPRLPITWLGWGFGWEGLIVCTVANLIKHIKNASLRDK